MKKMLMALAIVVAGNAAWAQASTAVKESGKAVGEKALEGKENAQAAVSGQPEKTLHKAKAKVHKAKSSAHNKKAKAASDQIGK